MQPQPSLNLIPTIQQAITALLTTYEPEFIRFGSRLFVSFATILIAWHGIRMVRELNTAFLEPLKSTFPAHRLGPLGDPPKVNCTTCHQGAYKPLLGVSMLKDYPELASAKPQPAKTVAAAPPPANPPAADPAAEAAGVKPEGTPQEAAPAQPEGAPAENTPSKPGVVPETR